MAHSDLVYLQGLVKGDPLGYREEAMKQHKQFLTQYEIFQLKPSKEHKEFSSLVKFLSQVAPCYPEELKGFPAQLAQLLEENALILEAKLRETLVRALVLLRSRNLLSPTSLLSLFFKLFRVPDKNLRQLLRNHIVSDIQRSNKRKHNNELNRALQNFMYSMLKDSSTQARESVGVMIELWRRNVWTDDKTINVISTGVFSQNTKVVAMTLNFFLSRDGRFAKEDDDEPILNSREIIRKFAPHHTKKTNKAKRRLSQKLSEAKKKTQQKLKDETIDEAQYNYAAIMGIHDPQTYCEKVFGTLKNCSHGFDLKIQLMNLCSRLIASHKLMVDGFYSFLQKHAQPHNKNITQILAILAQSCHPLVSPDVLEPTLQHLANTFVTDRRPVEVIAIGLNTIREVCLRAPLVMNATLLKDLCAYKRHKDKGIMMSSKSIISLFRTINPTLLPKKERGKNADLTIKPRQFGETTVLNGVDGAELLDEFGSEDFSEDMSEDMEEEESVVSVSMDQESEESGWEEVSDPEADEAPELVPIGDGEEESDEEVSNEEFNEDEWEWEVISNPDATSSEESNEEEESGEEGEEVDEDGFMAFDSNEEMVYDSYEESGDEESEDSQEQSNKEASRESFKKPKSPKKRSSHSTEEKSTRSKSEASADDHTSTDSSRRQRLDTVKILTDEEFQRIRKLKVLKAEREAATHKDKAILKRKLEQAQLLAGVDEDVDESAIAAGLQKKRKLEYQERVQQILENKEDKTGYSKFHRERKNHSITNEEKSKTKKPFQMLKQKSLEKQRLSQKQRKKKQAQHVKKTKSQTMNRHF